MSWACPHLICVDEMIVFRSYGAFINGSFFGSLDNMALPPPNDDIFINSGCSFVIDDIVDTNFNGIINGKYRTQNSFGIIGCNVAGSFAIADDNSEQIRSVFELQLGGWTKVDEYPFTRYIGPNSEEVLIPQAQFDMVIIEGILGVVDKRIKNLSTDISNDGVYPYVRKELLKMNYALTGLKDL